MLPFCTPHTLAHIRPQITAYRAGHVLGAAMFMVDIEGVRTLYTGDYSRVADRHLPAADTPAQRPDIREWRCRAAMGHLIAVVTCVVTAS